MRRFFHYFGGSTVFTVAALGLAFFVGYEFGGSLASGFSALFIAFMLGILETSLSFDNAVVNARVLSGMPLFWRRMFLTVGVLIAVFGMRILFPLLIVWIVSGLGFTEVVTMTWQDPLKFQDILVHQHVLIAGFGGAFLLMVFTKFFFDAEKDVHWIRHLEKKMSRLGSLDAFWVAVTMVVVLVFYNFLPDHDRTPFLLAAMLGIVTYVLMEGLSSLLSRTDEEQESAPQKAGPGLVSRGLASFLYLEVLDASFSFDGVIGSFAVTDNLFIIALGLGIGAMFVRSLTIKLVDDRTLSTYLFLEHGAFWAIGALSIIMFLGAVGIEVPEVVSGCVGLVFIALSFLTSLVHNRKSDKSALSPR